VRTILAFNAWDAKKNGFRFFINLRCNEPIKLVSTEEPPSTTYRIPLIPVVGQVDSIRRELATYSDTKTRLLNSHVRFLHFGGGCTVLKFNTLMTADDKDLVFTSVEQLYVESGDYCFIPQLESKGYLLYFKWVSIYPMAFARVTHERDTTLRPTGFITHFKPDCI
jgi:hypothetical protein